MRPEHVDRIEASNAAIALALETGLEAMSTEIGASRNAMPLHGAEYRSLVAGAGTGVRVMSSPGRIAGFSVRETTGAAAALVKLHDGADIGGDLVMTISLSAGESARDWFWPGGISLTYGLFCEVTTGAIEGVAYLSQT
jgi:hypothetical protein